MTAWLILAASIVAVGVVAGLIWRDFASADGTIRDRLCAAFRSSSTLFVNYASILMLALPEAVTVLSEALSDPALQEQVTAWFPPEYGRLVGLVLFCLSTWARMRTAGK